jgi:hypothetical protein
VDWFLDFDGTVYSPLEEKPWGDESPLFLGHGNELIEVSPSLGQSIQSSQRFRHLYTLTTKGHLSRHLRNVRNWPHEIKVLTGAALQNFKPTRRESSEQEFALISGKRKKVTVPSSSDGMVEKSIALIEHVEAMERDEQPSAIVWADDQHSGEGEVAKSSHAAALLVAIEHQIPVLLISPEYKYGLTQEDLAVIDDWLHKPLEEQLADTISRCCEELYPELDVEGIRGVLGHGIKSGNFSGTLNWLTNHKLEKVVENVAPSSERDFARDSDLSL